MEQLQQPKWWRIREHLNHLFHNPIAASDHFMVDFFQELYKTKFNFLEKLKVLDCKKFGTFSNAVKFCDVQLF